MTDLGHLKDILRELITGYLALKDILQQERALLVDLRPFELEELSKRKDLVLLRIRLLETERLRLMERMKKKMNTEREITLRRLYEITGDTTFLELRSRLLSLLQAVSELNDFNRILIERSLNYVRTASSLLESLGVNLSRGSMRMEV